jgi:hypothetical protein
MKLAVVGSRSFNDYKTLKVVLDELKESINIHCIVSGGANGADTLAERYAKENNIPIEVYKPDWNKHGKAAGFIRNSDIWNNSDLGVAFWDGKSKGTKHSFGIAKKQKKDLYVFDYIIEDFYLIKH